MEGLIKYNMLAKKEDRKISSWKSYPGLATIISMAREIVETGEKKQIEKLVKLMQGHESQQSATIVATIAILVGNKMDTEGISLSEERRRAFGDIMLWDTPVITNGDTWPLRQKYTFVQIFSDPEEMLETKMIVHGYLGNKASREMD